MNTESMQIIIGIGQILAVAIIPIIVWWLGIKYQDRKAKKEASAEKPAKAVKKSAVKAKPAKKVEAEVEEDEDDEE